MKRLWVSVGEVSGDIHASHVVQVLRKHNTALEIRGIGGEHLRNAGMECLFSISELSVMGVWEVLKRIVSIWKLVRAIKKDFQRYKPDALLVVDAPSFNFILIKIARKMGIPIYYYIIPKVWASRPKRAYFLSHPLTKLFCIFPFEIEWLQHYNITATYVGNPLLPYLRPTLEHSYTRANNHIIFMPGSRKSEIKMLFPLFIAVVQRLHREYPHLRFSYILAPSITIDYMQQYIPSDIPLSMIPAHERYSALAKATLCVVASGTATLESTLLQTPTIVTYKVGACSAWIMKQFIQIPFVSLPNIIMNEAIVPELLQENAIPDLLYKYITAILNNPNYKEKMETSLAELYSKMNTEHNSANLVANHILKDLNLEE